MSLKNLLFGAPLATHEEGEQRVGPLAGIPMLGLERSPPPLTDLKRR